jgi:DNA-binding SARP family transcriptional activator
LAGLALSAGRVVSVDRLIDLVWEHDPPASARRTVQSHVSGLRAAFGGVDAPLSAAGAGYVLAVERSDVDLLAFEDTIERARASDKSNVMRASIERMAAW